MDFDRFSFDFSTETQLRVHEALVALFDKVSAEQHPLAEKSPTELVRDKPVSREEAIRLTGDPASVQNVPEDNTLVLVRLIFRDPIIAALVSKAVATKEAVVCLCRNGFGCDAYALCRVLFENAVTLDWLLLPDEERDRNRRIDTYMLHFEAFKVRHARVIQEFQRGLGGEPASEISVDERTKEISAEVFSDQWMHWAWMPQEGSTKKKLVRLREMAHETGGNDAFLHDYFFMSALIHSAPASVCGVPVASDAGGHISDLGCFKILPELFYEEFRTRALVLSNLFAWKMLVRLNMRYKWGMEDEIRAIQLMSLRSQPESTDDHS